MPTTKTDALDLLNRYLHAVKFWLPKAQQQDILAELAEDLHSQVEEREAVLGHRLGEDELCAILTKRGSPLRVAAGYIPEQRLINPAMLPAYRLVLKITLLWVLLPLLVMVFIGQLFTSAHAERVLLLFWAEAGRTVFTVVGVVTMIFALLDHYHGTVKGLDTWDPRKLPRVPFQPDTSARWDQLAGFIFGMLAAVVWVYFLSRRTGFSFPGGPVISLTPIWAYVYWPILALTVAGAAADLVGFLHPGWSSIRSRVRIAIDACMLVLVATLFTSGNWVRIAASTLQSANLSQLMTWINASIQITLALAAVIIIGDAALEIRRILRLRAHSHTLTQLMT